MTENLGNLLDSAVKTAVFRLANAKRPSYPPPPPVDRSRVDYLYYDGYKPSYDYDYYNDYNDNQIDRQESGLREPPPSWLEHQSNPLNRWVKHAPPNRPTQWRPPKPNASAPTITDRIDRVTGGAMSRVGEVVAAAGGILPGIVAFPLIAAASYYLLVVNAPTPVVKERMAETATGLFDALAQTYRDQFEDGRLPAAFTDLLRQFLSEDEEGIAT